MTPESLQEHRHRQPFVPFRPFLFDGSAHEVRHPEMMLVMRREVVIAIPKPGEEFARRAVYCDPMHITRLEPINGHENVPKSNERN
jgi:hypothetical protein